jgi:hypothetical protein
MKRKAQMLSEDEEELLRLLRKRGARSMRLGFEADWALEQEEDGYNFWAAEKRRSGKGCKESPGTPVDGWPFSVSQPTNQQSTSVR